MVDLRHIRHLLAVASHPTVQAAAESLHLTQPALTKSIARFEDELGAKLFDRSGSRLVLTELGERVVARGQDLVRRVRDLEDEVQLWKGLETGEVSIGVDPETELGLLPDVLERFVPRHPHIHLTVHSGQTETLLPSLLTGDLHFLVADAEIAVDHDELEIQFLSPDSIAAALRPGHPLAKDKVPRPDAVRDCPRIGAFTAPRFERWRMESGRSEGRGPVTPSFVCDNYEVLVRLAESSDAIVFGPRTLLEAYAREERLRVMPWPLEGPQVQPALIRMKRKFMSPAAAQLISLFLNGKKWRKRCG